MNILRPLATSFSKILNTTDSIEENIYISKCCLQNDSYFAMASVY